MKNEALVKFLDDYYKTIGDFKLIIGGIPIGVYKDQVNIKSDIQEALSSGYVYASAIIGLSGGSAKEYSGDAETPAIACYELGGLYSFFDSAVNSIIEWTNEQLESAVITIASNTYNVPQLLAQSITKIEEQQEKVEGQYSPPNPILASSPT